MSKFYHWNFRIEEVWAKCLKMTNNEYTICSYDDGYWGDDYSYGSYDGYDDFGRNDRGRRMPPGGPMRYYS